ncbi:MAG: type II secretion system protein GspL [Gammaproteobacteria bacterium]|nr:type II secretion system protein GspL [Gammaproteobacteria bacterium]
MILYFSLPAPHRWVIVDRRNRVLEDGMADSLAHIPVRHRRITRRVGVVPGELVTLHSLRIPARSRAKAAAAVPYMLEESLASSVEDLEFRLLQWVRGGVSKVAVMSREAVAEWQAALADFPDRVDALVPDYLLLPFHTRGRCTVAADGEGRVVVRTGELDGLVIDEQELDLWWEDAGHAGMPVAVNNPDHARHLIERGGDTVSEWRIGRSFPEWLQHGHQVPEQADLLCHGGDSTDTLVSRRWMTAAAVLFGLAILIRVGVDAFDYFTLQAKESELDARIEAALTQAFPDITRVVNPRAQMEQRLAAMEGQATGSGFLVLLSVVADAIPGSSATVEEITYRNAALLVTCTTRDFQALDELQQRLAEDSRVSVELVSSGSMENSVNGRFRLNLRAG